MKLIVPFNRRTPDENRQKDCCFSDDYQAPFIDYYPIAGDGSFIFATMNTEIEYRSMKNKLSLLAIGILLIASACQNNRKQVAGRNTDSSTRSFGDSIPVSNGLMGKVFLLPDTTRSLPDFDTLTPLDNPIYVSEINIPWQKWSAGFPGLRDRFEWFGIEYTGTFKPKKAGNYLFKLISDDGSKLFIDDKLVINDDGIHSDWPVKDSVFLSDSIHSIKIDYFQGPRYELALQLFWSLGDSPEKIFPGKDFMLYTPKPASHWWLWLLIGLGVILIVLGVVYYKRRPILHFPTKGKDL